MFTRRTLLSTTLAAGLAAGAGALAAPAAIGAPAGPPAPAAAARDLTNLSHLRFLLAEVPLPAVPGHTTCQREQAPSALAPWTYADRRPDGSYARVGGGSLDPATGHWSQGAYNADDIARAAVVFVRAYRAFGDPADLETARQLLRSLTYLQVADGPRAGNVVLWQQSDGALNPSAEPVELPDPSDSDESYWLARTVWALGEGVRAFGAADREFTAFITQRLELALTALERASLSRYGKWERADGVKVPAWLIADGADATGEAVLGLVAFVETVPQHRRARRAMERYAEGIAAMSSGKRGEWPYGAIMPWQKSQSLWHAWGGLAPAALARASALTGSSTQRTAALADAGIFTPQLLTSGGPHNAWSPAPGEAQIAYGVQSRVETLLAAAEITRSEGFEKLAALAAGWFFGANLSGAPTYDPATGVTFDGVETDGRVNRNSGAETTIHGLLTMIDLDLRPAAKELARSIRSVAAMEGPTWLEAEKATLSGGAVVTAPASAWTGESNWHGAYVTAPRKSRIRFDLPAALSSTAGVAAPMTVHPVIHRFSRGAGTSRWFAVDAKGKSTLLGTLALGGAGAQGVTEWEGILKPYPLDRPLPEDAAAIVVESNGALELDAVILLPAVRAVRYASTAGSVALRASTSARTVEVPFGPGERGRAWASTGEKAAVIDGRSRGLVSGGFAITTA